MSNDSYSDFLETLKHPHFLSYALKKAVEKLGELVIDISDYDKFTEGEEIASLDVNLKPNRITFSPDKEELVGAPND